ncbi:K domain type 1 [Trinorchestia longiramus]|nr:K domain type 1 [Trinorchestia longiramus]
MRFALPGARRARPDLRYVDVIRERPIRVTAKVLVPVREHPKFNFVGKLLGPKGNSMKRLQEETLTKMAVLGRGSMRDKQKEEELRASGDPKYLHLLEDLHVEITAFAPPAEAHARIAYSLAEIRRYLVPDNNDDIRKQQIREMEYIGGDRKDSGSLKSVDGGDALNGHGGPAVGRMDVEERSGRAISPAELRRSDPGSPNSSSSLVSPMGGNILPPLHHPHHPLPPPLPLPHPHHHSISLFPSYYYEEYDDYGGMEDYTDLYNADCYDGAAGGGWSRYKPMLPTTRDRPMRCRSSPYSRPK